jgi:two-component system, cell cycle response regulator DivK
MSLTRDRIGKRALVVEDNPFNMRLFSDLLDGLGCEVFQASTARDAVKAAHECRPDLILMDIRLPDGSGLDVTRWLKQDDQTKAIPIIALTASALAGDRAAAYESGCDAFLEKPIVVDEFLRTIDDFLPRVLQ